MSSPSTSGGNPFRAILDVGAALVSSLELDQVFANVAEKIGEAMMVWSVDIQTFDRERGTLLYEAYWSQAGLTDEDRAYVGTVTEIRDRPDWLRVVEGRDVVECHIDDPHLPAKEREEMKKWGYKTTLDAPLMVGDQVIGILGLGETRFVRKFTSIEADLFSQLCDLAAVAIRNAQVYRRQRDQTRQLDALVGASRAITSSVLFLDVMETVAKTAAEALGTQECVIYEYDPLADALVWRGMYPMDEYHLVEERVGTEYPLDESPTDRTILSGGVPVSESISDADLPEDTRVSMDEWGEKTCLNVPLMFRGEPVGIMVLIEKERERRFSEEELDLARALGEQAAVAIRNAQAYERQREGTRRVSALLDAGKAITSTVDPDEVLARVTREACNALGVDATSVYEYDARTDLYCYRALHEATPSVAPGDDDALGTWYPLADYPSDRQIMDGHGAIVHNLSNPDLPPDRRASMAQFGEQTTVNVPLRVGDERLGILRFYVYGKERRFTDSELQLASGLGEQAAIAIANARLYASIDRQKDGLAALLDVGRAIGSTVDLDEVLERVTREACLALDVSATAVYEYDGRGDRYTYRAAYSVVPSPDTYDGIGLVYEMAAYPGDRTIMLSDVPVEHHLSDPDLPADRRASMAYYDEQTVLNVPLRFGDERLGILRFYVYEHERRFSDDEVALARGIGEQAAIAIANARLYEDVGRQQARLSSLLDAGRALTSTLVPKEVFDTITQRSAEAIGSPRCALYEYDPAAATLTARSIFEPEPTPGYYVLDVPEPISLRPADKAILDGREIVVEAISDAGLHAATRAEMEFWDETTVLNVPLSSGGEPLGILMVIFTGDERTFSDDELALAAGLGEQAAIAIYNARLHESVDRERQRAAALFSASRTLTSSLVSDEVMALVTRRAAETVRAPRCDLYECDAAADTLTLRGYFEEVPSGLYASIGEPEALDERPGDRIILESGEVVVQTLSDPSLDPATRAEMEAWGEKTCLNVPLVVKGEPLGILIVTETEHERRFSDDEIEFARAFGEQVGMALQNARLFRRLETQNQRLLSLLQSSRVMTGAMNVEKAVATMCSEMANLLDCPVCHIDVGLRREGGDFLPPEVFAAEDEVVAANREPPLVPDELTERALSARQPQQSEDDQSGSRLVIPLLSKDEPSGFVELSGPLRARFGEDELEVVQILANQAATAIDNARMYQDQERQAITDGLTGLYNHRFFYDRLRSEMARSLRYLSPLSLLILDVDDFKTFNDTYGHMAGDEALREIGRLLRLGVREHIDIACRYGGEEFAVILPNTPVPGARAAGERLQDKLAGVGLTVDATQVDRSTPVGSGDDTERLPDANPSGAVVVGERIRATVESTKFRDEGGSALRGVTVSVGVAAFPDHGVSGDALVAAADKALYVAKSRGKNRVEVGETIS